jgi:regulatory protein
VRNRSPFVRPQREATAGTITAVMAGPRRSQIVLTLDDGVEYVIAARIFAESGLDHGISVTVSAVQALLDADDLAAARNSAFRMLAVRARSVKELTTALTQRGYPAHIVDRVIQECVDRGYLDDSEFARRFVAVRAELAPRGTRLLKRELKAKGIDDEVADETIAEADQDDLEVALRLARHRMERMADLPRETWRRRIAGFLERRGFNWEVVRNVDRALCAEFPEVRAPFEDDADQE